MDLDIWYQIETGGRGLLLETSVCLQEIRRDLKLEIGSKLPEAKLIDYLTAKNIPDLTIMEMLEILERENLLDKED